jgi:hypothetical protein
MEVFTRIQPNYPLAELRYFNDDVFMNAVSHVLSHAVSKVGFYPFLGHYRSVMISQLALGLSEHGTSFAVSARVLRLECEQNNGVIPNGYAVAV